MSNASTSPEASLAVEQTPPPPVALGADHGLIERLLDHLINPANCIDTFGRTYIDDLEYIVVENHRFDFATQTFPDVKTQEWFDRVRSHYRVQRMEDVISYVREHLHAFSIANLRPRTDLHIELITEWVPAFDTLNAGSNRFDQSNEAQRIFSQPSVGDLPLNETDADHYELYLGDDRLNPWTYLLRREIARKRLAADAPVICIGNRWLGEILYFRRNIGLRKTRGLDLFSSDPDLVVVGDMHRMPFEDGSIKLVFIRQALSKSHNVRLVVGEILRVLEPTGYVIIEIPGPYGWGVSRMRGTDVKSARNILRLFGTKIKRIVYMDEVPPYKAGWEEDCQRLIRVFVEIDKNGTNDQVTVDRPPGKRLEIYQWWRRHWVRSRFRLRRLPGAIKRRIGSRRAWK